MKQTMLIGRYSASKGISVYEFENGKLAFLKDSCDVINPSYLCAVHDKVYALTETTTVPSEFADGVTVYQKDKGNNIQFLWSCFQGNLGSCYITFDLSERVVFMANYKDGSISASLIDNLDVYKENIITVVHESAGQNIQSHVHYLCFTPDNKYLCAVDLGLDLIVGYTFSIESNHISLKKVFETKLPIGTGPRHMCFSVNQKYAFVCGELNSSVMVLEYLGEQGFQVKQTLPSTFNTSAIPNYPSAIKLSKDGRYLYVANRGADSMSVFEVCNDTDELNFIQEICCGGKYPRDFSFDITEEYIVVANQNSNNLCVFHRDSKSGLLKQIDTINDVETPTCVLFYKG